MKKQVVDNIAIYLRLSSEDNDNEESESITNQRKLICDYITKNFEYKNIYEYVDDGYSGSNFNRPAFKKMIKELKEKKINLIITKNLARFARNYIDSGEYIEKKFPNLGVRYIAILDGVDNFSDKMENEIAPFKGLFNEMYCRETSKNIRRSKKKKREEGFYSCTIPPFGYKKDPENPGKLIIDEKVSNIVKEIFLMKYKGKTSKEIAKYLNEKKIITPARYMNIFRNREIDIWTGEGVSRLVSKPVYVGDTYMGKNQNVSYKSKKKIINKRLDCVITKDTHEAIISREIFDAIHNNNKYNNYKAKIPNVDTKLGDYIYCDYCKRKMRKVNKNGKIVLYCGAYLSSEELCINSKRFFYDDIEETILNTIKEDVSNFLYSKYSRQNVYKGYKEKKLQPILNEKVVIEKEKNKLLFEISSLYNDRLEHKITEEQYKVQYQNLLNNRKKLDKQLEDISKNIQMVNNESDIRENIKEIRKVYKKININKFDKEDFKYLINKIFLGENKIEIEFKFKK